jgi:hypothetical protein
VLAEHFNDLSRLLSVVECCWQDGDFWHALLRLGRGQEADSILHKVEDALPVNVSLGAKILDSRTEPGPDGETVVRATRWLLTEISLLVFGADPNARVIANGEEAVRMAEGHMASDRERRRGLAEGVLKAPAWRSWAVTTGDALAERFGVANPEFSTALYAEVEAKIGALAEQLAEVRA